MTDQEATQIVATKKPSLLYITGKTSTGKTTFAMELSKRYGYHIVVLDEVVKEAIIQPLKLENKQGDVFVSVYRMNDRPEWIDRFVMAVRARIEQYVSQGVPVLIEGALANTDTIARIFAGYPDAQVLYFHPKAEHSRYAQNLQKRFMGTNATDRNGLPNGFWKHIPSEAFTQFCADRVITPELQQAIDAYCRESTKESHQRLAMFQQHLSDLHVVEI